MYWATKNILRNWHFRKHIIDYLNTMRLSNLGIWFSTDYLYQLIKVRSLFTGVWFYYYSMYLVKNKMYYLCPKISLAFLFNRFGLFFLRIKPKCIYTSYFYAHASFHLIVFVILKFIYWKSYLPLKTRLKNRILKNTGWGHRSK